jgi:tRNA pseudouridine32 synthase/23S rRNA pseudouridine746 synthase
MFSKRTVEKRYLAIVAGDFSANSNPLRVERSVDGKEAISEFSLRQVSNNGDRSLVEVCIETGRKHQVRRHLAELGHPVIGDRLYGAGETDGVDLLLTAYVLEFHCPIADERVEYRLGSELLPAL